MTNNQKILVGLGLGAVAFYVYKMRGKKDQDAVTKPQSQDNKGQNPPTSSEKPQRGQTYEEVVRSGGGGIKLPSKDPYGRPIIDYKWDPEAEALNWAKLKKYGAKFNLAKEGDRLTTSYGTYEYRRKPTGGPLSKGFTTGWDKI